MRYQRVAVAGDLVSFLAYCPRELVQNELALFNRLSRRAGSQQSN
jgi:hypothetical protein